MLNQRKYPNSKGETDTFDGYIIKNKHRQSTERGEDEEEYEDGKYLLATFIHAVYSELQGN